MTYREFGETLKKLRKGRGPGCPSFDTLIRTAQFFGVTTDYLLGVARTKAIDVAGLTDSQIEALHHLIQEFNQAYKS